MTSPRKSTPVQVDSDFRAACNLCSAGTSEGQALNARHRTRGDLNVPADAEIQGPRAAVVVLLVVTLCALSVSSCLAGVVLGWSP